MVRNESHGHIRNLILHQIILFSKVWEFQLENYLCTVQLEVRLTQKRFQFNDMHESIHSLNYLIGVAPHRVLPVVLDVGTDNEELLNDPFYLGVPKPRLTGEKYYELVDEFMQAVRYRWPKVLVQFEDFSSDKVSCNDSIYIYSYVNFIVGVWK